MQSLSNWADLPTPAGAAPSSAASLGTSIRYAAEKLTSAAVNRHKIFIVIDLAIAYTSPKLAPASLLESGSFEWESLRRFAEYVPRAARLAIAGPPWSLAHTHPQNDPPKALSEEQSSQIDSAKGEKQDDGDSASSSSGDSHSSDTADPDELDDIFEDFPVPFRAAVQGQVHFQQYLLDSGPIPFCRNSPFQNHFPEDEHAVIARGLSPDLCRHCLRVMPMVFKKLLRAQN